VESLLRHEQNVFPHVFYLFLGKNTLGTSRKNVFSVKENISLDDSKVLSAFERFLAANLNHFPKPSGILGTNQPATLPTSVTNLSLISFT
jgi:hypothetical protein